MHTKHDFRSIATFDEPDRKQDWTIARRLWSVCALLALLASAACVEVSNPGPVQDDFLNDATAHPALVNGAGRALSEAINWVAHTGAVVTREQRACGNVTAFGVTPQQDAGILVVGENDQHWDNSQRARWLAEETVRRIRENVGESAFSSDDWAARALLYAGYANRLLGENMCNAVIDGGAPAAPSVYLDRAEAAFTEAIAVATQAGVTDVELAALAGRASVRVSLGDWSGAVSDADAVPTDFAFSVRYSAIDLDQYNRIMWSGANQPYRTLTTWGTVYESYYETTNDPRTPWDTLPGYPFGDNVREGIGHVPFYNEKKYPERETPINVSTGWETQLIKAEALLQTGDWQGAMQIINARRLMLGVSEWTANNLDEAWTHLKRERGIELWLEARRLNDLRRWAAAGTPGQVDPTEDLTGKDTCFPYSLEEINTNPNIS